MRRPEADRDRRSLPLRAARPPRLYAMEPPDNRSIDWTGVQPDDSPIEPLDGRTFLLRLNRLEQHVHELRLLRRALKEQQCHGRPASRDPD